MGVHVDDSFLRMVKGFLHLRLGCFPFKYLGLPVGANPRSARTWDPLINLIESRLNSWTNRFVSLGGRVVLINFDLNFIPIFFLSFMKMSVKVWK